MLTDGCCFDAPWKEQLISLESIFVFEHSGMFTNGCFSDTFFEEQVEFPPGVLSGCLAGLRLAIACRSGEKILCLGFDISVLDSCVVGAAGKSIVCLGVCGGSEEDSGLWFGFTCMAAEMVLFFSGDRKWVLRPVSAFSVKCGLGGGGSSPEDCDPCVCFFWGLVATTGKLCAILQIPDCFGFLGWSTLLCLGESSSGPLGGSGALLGLPLFPGTLNIEVNITLNRVSSDKQQATLTFFRLFGSLYHRVC